MKKIIFILCVSFFIANASAEETETNMKESTTIEFASSTVTKESNSNKAFFARVCCRKTVRNAEGESWTARRCFTHSDSRIAMGRACEMAAADANNAMSRASTYTFTDSSI